MRFAFRVDSSPTIGTGHLIRCLTLADCLHKSGFECLFICRDFQGADFERVAEKGFELKRLPASSLENNETWLGMTAEKDVLETLEAFGETPPDWLIVDHYAIDAQWEKQVRREVPNTRILVIDDLADRQHDCEILLDQTFGRGSAAYTSLVGLQTRLLLGTGFALLRPEFRKIREEAVTAKQISDAARHILVILGGSDISQPLTVIGEALLKLSRTHEFSATVFCGKTDKAALKPYLDIGERIELLEYSDDVANEMARADFAIGAGGGTSWERCCVGLPTLVLTLADNQREISRILCETGAGLSVDIAVDDIHDASRDLLEDTPRLLEMGRKAMDLCDGRGVSRVMREIVDVSLDISPSAVDDARFIFDARYSDNGSRYYRNPDIPHYESHVDWLEKALSSPDRTLITLSFGGVRIAHARLDQDTADVVRGEIGICMAPEWRGKGMGLPVLKVATDYFVQHGSTIINAEVHKDNAASAVIFEQVGYVHVSTDNDGFMRYSWQA